MQTFLPYESFIKSASVLDNKRLGKQRLEAWQIYRVLTSKRKSGWKNHPAVLMWKGNETTLLWYGYFMCSEWSYRGFSNKILMPKFRKALVKRAFSSRSPDPKPKWMGNRKFHESHRSNLLRKNHVHYRNFWPKLRDDLPYYWPVRKKIK